MTNQFVPPNGLPDATPVGTDGTTLGSLKTETVKTDGGDVSNTVATAAGGNTARALKSIFGDRINALDYGVSTDSSDNAIALQAAIDAAIAKGVTLYIPSGHYKFTPPLIISSHLHIQGDSCLPIWGDYFEDSNSTNIPTVAPYFNGTVLSAVSNGKSIFVDTATTQICFSGSDFACTFQTPFSNTGHMVDSSSTSKIGLQGAMWRNVGLFGHDGDHYMFNLTNILYCRFENTTSYGGGLVSSRTTIYNGGCGNSVWERTLSILAVKGSADCYHFDATGDGLSQQYNAFIGVQGMTYDASKSFPGLTPPATQNMFYCGPNCNSFSFLNPDFEAHSGSGETILPSGYTFLDRTAGSLANLTWHGGAYPAISPDYLQKGSAIQSGTFTATATTGTLDFPSAFTNAVPAIIISGRGITASVTGTPSASGFQYSLSAAGTFDWIAHGY